MSKDSKKVNATTINFLMRIGVLKLRRELREVFDKFPEDASGVEVHFDDFESKFNSLTSDGIEYVKELLGAMPEISDDDLDEYEEEHDKPVSLDEMDPESYRRNQDIYFKSYKDKSFQWMNKTGAYYGGPVLFVYADGTKMFVPDAKVTHGYDGNTDNTNQKYYMCGTDPEHQHGMSGRASIFTGKGDVQTKVTIYFNG